MWLISLLCSLFSWLSTDNPALISPNSLARGHLPVVVADSKGAAHLVFGQDSTIYYAVSSKYTAFDQPIAVATLSQLVAGAKRGPQVAVTDKYVVITAVNRAGDIFAYSLDRKSGKWSPAARINDVPEIAKEGFQAVAGTAANTFYATWLDLRDDKHNKIVMAASRDGGRTWSTNRVVYRSPSGSVCECCKVSIAANQNDVYIQFRNWVDGGRDLYLAHSSDGGVNFASAQKLGVGTWKLNACPMDGGALTLLTKGQPLTVWRRENTLYSCRPGEPEQPIAVGHNISAATNASNTALAWDENGMIWLKLNTNKPVTLGKGQLPSVAVSKKTALCVWEMEGQVKTASLSF